MTKQKIIGMAACILVILASAGMIFYFLTLDKLPEDQNPGNDVGLEHSLENQVIYKGDITQIDYVEIQNKHGSYRIRQNEDGNIVIVGKEKAPLLHYSSSGLYSSVKSVKCDLLIEKNAKDLAVYGLQQPAASVTVRTLDGGETKFHIGDREPMGEGYYLRMDASSDVYLVNTTYAERYLTDFISLYDTKIFKYFKYENLKTLDIQPAGGQEISLRATTAEEKKNTNTATNMLLEKPFLVGADDSMLQEIAKTLAAVEATSVATDEYINDALRAEYGFDNPAVVKITMEVDTASYSLETGEQNPYYGATEDGSPLLVSSTYYLGKSDGQNMYIMYDDSPVVYVCNAEDFAFAGTDVYQFCQRIINIKYLNDLSGLTIEAEDKTYDFVIENPDAGDEMSVTYNYAVLSPSLFRDFYVSLVGITHIGIGDKPDGEVVLRVTYKDQDGSRRVLEFIQYPEDERTAFFSVDGEGHFKVLMTKVEKIINDMKKLINGEQILS